MNDCLQLEETLAWFFVPHLHRGSRHQFGAQYEYSTAFNTNQGNLNGTFSFGRSNVPFDSAVPSTYPDRFSIRVGGPSTFYQKSHYVSTFAQDKWRFNRRLTFSLGLRYDLEVLPIAETDDPLVEKYPTDGNNWRRGWRDLRCDGGRA